MYPLRGFIIIDCGFNIFREVPVKKGARFKKNEVVQLIKIKKGYLIKRSKANHNALYTYKAYIERIIDANYLFVSIDCGFGIWVRRCLKLNGISSPSVTIKKGKIAKKFVEKALKLRHFIIVKTFKNDNYNHFLADVFCLPGEINHDKVAQEGKFLNQELIDNKLAVCLGS